MYFSSEIVYFLWCLLCIKLCGEINKLKSKNHLKSEIQLVVGGPNVEAMHFLRLKEVSTQCNISRKFESKD
jgi:hypothetical protein